MILESEFLAIHFLRPSVMFFCSSFFALHIAIRLSLLKTQLLLKNYFFRFILLGFSDFNVNSDFWDKNSEKLRRTAEYLRTDLLTTI